MYRIYFIDNCSKLRNVTVNNLNNVNLGSYNFIVAIEYCGELIDKRSISFSESQNLEKYFYGVRPVDGADFLLNNAVLQPADRHLMLSTTNSFRKLIKTETITLDYVCDSGDIGWYVTCDDVQITLPDNIIGNRCYCISVGAKVSNNGNIFPFNAIKCIVNAYEIHNPNLSPKGNTNGTISQFNDFVFRNDLSFAGGSIIVGSSQSVETDEEFGDGTLTLIANLYELTSF